MFLRRRVVFDPCHSSRDDDDDDGDDDSGGDDDVHLNTWHILSLGSVLSIVISF